MHRDVLEREEGIRAHAGELMPPRRKPFAVDASDAAPCHGRSSASAGLAIIAAVPRISEFYGITIEMYFRDHPPPHLHARYGGEEAVIGIATGEVIAGSLPGRALRLVREWTRMHRDDLNANWERARARTALASVAPLP